MIGTKGRASRASDFAPNSPLNLTAASRNQSMSRPLTATQSTPDEVLIERIAGGDRLAMQVLFARHHVRVYRFVLRLVRKPDVAEDLISEVFLDVWRQADRFEGRSAVTTWLLAIARFKALSALRRRPDEELDEEAAAAIEDPSDNPEIAVEKKDKGQVLRQCLAALSPEHREIIDLVYYHEKSVEEAAEIVGIPANTVKTRMFYARKKLGELLKERGIERGWP
jgi:RNA polymerase sigma-70 factor, ECF subfamily